MQSVSSRIWTRMAVFISYGDNDYTTGTSTGVPSVIYSETFLNRTDGELKKLNLWFIFTQLYLIYYKTNEYIKDTRFIFK